MNTISIPVWEEDFEEPRELDGRLYQPYPIGTGAVNARLRYLRRYGTEPKRIFALHYTLWAGPVKAGAK